MGTSQSRGSFSLSEVWPYLVAAVMIAYVIILLILVAGDVTKLNAVLRSI